VSSVVSPGLLMIAGWLANFIPYCFDGKGRIKPARKDHHLSYQGLINGIEFSEESITQTEFILNSNGKEYNMMLVAGFFVLQKV